MDGALTAASAVGALRRSGRRVRRDDLDPQPLGVVVAVLLMVADRLDGLGAQRRYRSRISLLSAPPSRRRPTTAPGSRRRLPRTRWLLLAAVPVLLVAAAAWAVLGASGVRCRATRPRWRSIHLQTLAGSLESARATTPAGKPVPLEVRDGRLTPKVRLTPGERIDVEVVVRRPGALSWALGDTRREHLTITTPVVHPTTRWLSVPHGSAVTVAFDGAVAGEAIRAPHGGPCDRRGPASRSASSPPPGRRPSPSPHGPGNACSPRRGSRGSRRPRSPRP